MRLAAEWDREGHGADAYVPFSIRIEGDEELDPLPPRGWFGIFRYETGKPIDPRRSVGWVCLVAKAQDLAVAFGRRHHMITRQPDGSRVLAVDPAIVAELEQVLAQFDRHLTAELAWCNGWTTLMPRIQLAAARVFAKRAYPKVPLLKRLDLLRQLELPPSLALSGPSWLDLVSCPATLHGLAERGYFETTRPPRPFLGEAAG